MSEEKNYDQLPQRIDREPDINFELREPEDALNKVYEETFTAYEGAQNTAEGETRWQEAPYVDVEVVEAPQEEKEAPKEEQTAKDTSFTTFKACL